VAPEEPTVSIRSAPQDDPAYPPGAKNGAGHMTDPAFTNLLVSTLLIGQTVAGGVDSGVDVEVSGTNEAV